MRASYNWLKRYIDLSAPPEEIAHRLTMVGLEVESFEDLGKKYENFVVGRVLEVEKHANADKLSVCKVNVREKILQIVCGAPNVAIGQKVIVGLVGAIVPHNQHDPLGKPFKLTNAKIRGVESFGMICSASELGLGEDKSGVLVLPADAPVGTPVGEYFQQDDVVFEIGVTPNRPDALSHIGIARELGGLYNLPLNIPEIDLKEGKLPIAKHASITVDDSTGCPRYTARAVFGVKIAESPAWLQGLLKTVGVRSVNNVVDITNYVLMEIGQPIHAFDYDKLRDHTIRVRRASEEESFVTLDHKERKLKNDTLMICDGQGPVAIAGVMGGMESEIWASTKNVLIESAYFAPGTIRRTSKFLGLSTDASQRFERGCDPNITAWAADRVASLIHEICGGEILANSIDVYPDKVEPKQVTLRVRKTNEVLGTSLSGEKISQLLGRIGITQTDSNKDGSLTFEVPTFRPDIEREIDLVEEVARLHGYDNIDTNVRTSIQLPEAIDQVRLDDTLRSWLVGRGYYEVISNSMLSNSLASIDSADAVQVANPISVDMAALRTNLVISALQVIRNNIHHGTKNLRFFEIGKTYFREFESSVKRPVEGFREENCLLLAISGFARPQSWSGGTPRNVDIFDLKGELEGLFSKISLDKFKFIPYTTSNALTDIGLSLEIYGTTNGHLGRVREDLRKKFDIEQDVFFAQLSLDAFSSGKRHEKIYHALPEYPSVLRDIALITDEAVASGDLHREISEAGGKLLSRIELFDIYRGDQIGSGKKSSAFALEFQSLEKTLSQQEVDETMSKILKHLSIKFNASLRM